MANSIKKTGLMIIALLLGTLTASQSFGNEYAHIDNLALKIERKANALLRQTPHYRHTCNYRHMVADCAELTRLAGHIHELVHHEADIFHVEADLVELDRTFHHIEELFDDTELDAAYGRGHVHGNTAHVKALLNAIEDCIHHMQDDIRAIRRRVVRNSRVAVPTPTVVRTYSAPWGGSGQVVTRKTVSYGGVLFTNPNIRPYHGYGYGGLNNNFGVYGNRGGFDRHDHDRGHAHGNRNRQARSHGDHHGHSNRGRNSRPGFTIGGGSSQIRINF